MSPKKLLLVLITILCISTLYAEEFYGSAFSEIVDIDNKYITYK